MGRLGLASIGVTMLLGSTALAGPPQVWPFDVESSGEDINWMSPTAVNPNAPAYRSEFQINLVEVTVLLFGFPLDVDVTDQIPPEAQNAVGCADGPAPIVLLEDSIAFPLPPDPPSIAVDLAVGIDADGFGTLSATNIVLGSVDVPPFGSLPLTGFRIAGQVTMTPFNPPDVNDDGVVNVQDLVAVITGWGLCPADPPVCAADTNCDGVVDVLDLLAVILGWS